jgi:hypothetical protein
MYTIIQIAHQLKEKYVEPFLQNYERHFKIYYTADIIQYLQTSFIRRSYHINAVIKIISRDITVVMNGEQWQTTSDDVYPQL